MHYCVLEASYLSQKAAVLPRRDDVLRDASDALKRSSAVQGGELSRSGAMQLLALEGMDDVMALRRWDDRAKVNGVEVLDLNTAGRWSWTISFKAGFKQGQLPGSCTPSIPVAQNSRDNSWTIPQNQLQSATTEWQ